MTPPMIAALVLVLGLCLLCLACLFTAWYYNLSANKFARQLTQVERKNSYLESREAVWLTTVREQARHSVRLYEQNMALRELPAACESCPARAMAHLITVPILPAMQASREEEYP